MYDDVASVVLLFYLFVIALAILFSEGVFVSALLCSMFSLIIASAYMVMGAIDVAITEAIVGAGVSTIFFLNAINKVGKSRRLKRGHFHLTASMLAMVVTCFALLFSIADMPAYGDARGPAHNHIYDFYISAARDRFHFVDVVTAVLASIRGYDTLGETTVVMLAAVSVILIMGLGNEKT